MTLYRFDSVPTARIIKLINSFFFKETRRSMELKESLNSGRFVCRDGYVYVASNRMRILFRRH